MALKEQLVIRQRAHKIIERMELKELTEQQRTRLWCWIVAVGNGETPCFE